MTSAELTSLIWKLIIAIAPIIMATVMKLVTDTIANMTTASREKLEYWIGIFVKMAQMMEPDSGKRKAFVVAQILKMFPKLDPEQLSALIEAVVAEIKLDDGTSWQELPPTTTPPDATPPLA
jgi:hypothetical protein